MDRNKNVTGNKTLDGNFLNVLLALKQNVMKDLNVADIAIIEQIKDNYNIYCKQLNNNLTTIVATKLNNLELSIGDCVVILYINDDFRLNLKRLKSNQSIVNTTETNYHTKNYGVIIGKL